MVKVKRIEVRTAILEAAAELFESQGYVQSTIPKIAMVAGISSSSVYVYFKSKLEIAIAVYEPWIHDHLQKLERDLANIDDGRERLRLILTRIWRDIPLERNCFANNIIQAISTATPEDHYRPSILGMLTSKVSAMIYASLPPRHRSLNRSERIAHLVVMAFDGFTINRYLPQRLSCDDETVDLFCDAILVIGGASRHAEPVKRLKRRSVNAKNE